MPFSLNIPAIVVTLVLLQACSFNHGDLIRDVRAVAINGEVQSIDLKDGLKVRLKDEGKYYLLTGYCNETGCLQDQITFKDSLKKDIGTDVVYLKKKYSDKVTTWRLKPVR